MDDAKGMHGNHITYDDTDIAQLKSIPETAIHRNVDLAVLAADKEGYVRSYLIYPSIIYGLATGPIFDAKLANPHSVMVPVLVKAAIDRGRSGMVGNGKNVWPLVHILDTAEFFIVLLENILKPPDGPGHGWEGFYFAENERFTSVDLATRIGDELAWLNKISDASPTTFTKEDLVKYFGGVSTQSHHSLFCMEFTGTRRVISLELTHSVLASVPVHLGGLHSIPARTVSLRA
jgi:nucleoside-diphosphate-sugar epimerase